MLWSHACRLRLRERQRKIPVPALDDDDDGAEPAQSALLSAPKLEPVVHNGTTPAFIPEPDISTLHEGRPHLALKHVLAWQRQQVALQAGPGSSAARAGGAGLGAAPAASAAAATGSRPSGDTAGSGPSRKAQLALAVPASAMEGDAVPGLLHGFDLTGLLRCLHVHKVTGPNVTTLRIVGLACSSPPALDYQPRQWPFASESQSPRMAIQPCLPRHPAVRAGLGTAAQVPRVLLGAAAAAGSWGRSALAEIAHHSSRSVIRGQACSFSKRSAAAAAVRRRLPMTWHLLLSF